MSKAIKTIGLIAGAVALVATGVGAFAVAGSALAATASSVATYATLAAGVSQLGSSALAKPPPARGSVTDALIEVDPPSPYAMGEGYFAGVKRHHAGYGATLDKVPNPYLWEVYALSVGGPIEGPITPQFDFKDVTGFYTSFFKHDTKLGAIPDTALASGYGSAPGWGADYKMSGTAAIGFNHLFDKKGKRYASGLPTRGVLGKWVKVYDPRKDSTFPGGAGTHRLGVESTYEWSESPALHAGTYAFGRYQNGKRVFGMGLPVEAIDFEAIAAWANDCVANGWRMFGVIFEGAGITPGQRWQNLRDICIAGGAEPLPLYTGIGFHWDRPRVVLDTITEADVAGEIDATGMQSYRDRINTIVPEYLSAVHNWERIPAEPIIGSTYLAEDGEPNTAVFPFNFVKDAKQAGQLAAYKLANGREIYPVSIDLMPRLSAYRPGDCLYLNIPAAGLETPSVMLTRQVDPATGSIKAVFMGETAAKHAYALGETAVPPPTPYIGMTAQERDELAAAANSDATPQIIGPSFSVVQAKTNGDAAEGQLPSMVNYALLYDGDVRTLEAIWSVSVVSGTLTISIDTSGTVTISAMPLGEATYKVTAAIDGVSTEFIHKMTKRIAGVDINTGTGGTSSADNSFNSFSTTGFFPVSDIMNITTGTAGEVELSAPLTMQVASGSAVGNYTATLRWQRDISGTWTDVGTAAVSGTSTVEPDGLVIPANVTANEVLTLPASTAYSFRLTAKANEADAVSRFLTGTASAVGK